MVCCPKLGVTTENDYQKVLNSFAKKFKNCEICNFYQTVKKEEFPNFQLSATLIKKIAGR